MCNAKFILYFDYYQSHRALFLVMEKVAMLSIKREWRWFKIITQKSFKERRVEDETLSSSSSAVCGSQHCGGKSRETEATKIDSRQCTKSKFT